MILQTLGVYTDIFGDEPLTLGKALIIAVIGILVVFVILGIIALFIVALGKLFGALEAKKKAATASDIPAQTNAAPAAPAPVKAEVKLIDVSEEEAAIIMAIVSDRSGIPLSHLKFNTIKPVEEK